MKFLTAKWPFYATGGLIAFLFVFNLYLLNTPIGMSDAYISLSEYCQDVIEDEKIREFFPVDWQTGFIFGVFIGALCAVIFGKEWKFNFFPEDRKNKKFIPSCIITPIQGIIGGFLVMAGLQLAGDSFIGQWAAAMQLSTAAWIFLPVMAISGVTVTIIANKFGAGGGGGGGKSGGSGGSTSSGKSKK